jgi:hypothetical protein
MDNEIGGICSAVHTEVLQMKVKVHYATNRQVAVSIPDSVIGIFQ